MLTIYTTKCNSCGIEEFWDSEEVNIEDIYKDYAKFLLTHKCHDVEVLQYFEVGKI